MASAYAGSGPKVVGTMDVFVVETFGAGEDRDVVEGV